MDNKVTVRSRSVWGSTYYYPECPISKMLCEISKRKTMTPRVMELLKKHGFEMVIQEEV
jgi:hypothetical protein